MTRAYARFLAELDQRGPEKKDGFDAANIGKLAGEERDEARRRLVQAISNGDDTAVGALVALDGSLAFETLTPLLSKADEYVQIRIIQSLPADKREDVAAALGNLFESRQSVIRVQALAVVQEWPDSATRIVLLARYLASETDALYRSGAARSLLQTVGRAPNDAEMPPFGELLDALRGDDATKRAHALAQLGA